MKAVLKQRHKGVEDFIKVDDISGTVETIGLRSTRIRTPSSQR